MLDNDAFWDEARFDVIDLGRIFRKVISCARIDYSIEVPHSLDEVVRKMTEGKFSRINDVLDSVLNLAVDTSNEDYTQGNTECNQ